MTNYSGLTIILSDPGRHDKDELISGYAGNFFWNLLIPLYRGVVNLRLTPCKDELLPNTKVVLLLGQGALDLLNTGERLDIIHGYPILRGGVVYIPTFTPQDSFDRKNYEGEEEDQPAETEDTAAKTSGRTQRRNYKFWLYYDTKKALRILKNGLSIPRQDLETIFNPPASTVIRVLNACKNLTLFIDIETDKNLNLTCFGFSTLEGHSTWVVPWKLYTGQLAYSNEECYKIIQALSCAFNSNLIVAHNSCFDLFVLALKYHVPFPRQIFDTMLAWARVEPEVEKSLARVISYFLDVEYHKSEGVYDPKTWEQQDSLWKYNAKDVETLKLIYNPLLTKAKEIGATSSIEQINSSIYPYLTVMFQGIKLDIEKMKNLYQDFNSKYIQLVRCLEIITGREDFNPRSPKQVEEYLYTDLQLERPSKDFTNERQLLKILTKQNIPSIKFILACRSSGKSASSLKFQTWGKDRTTTSYRLAGTDTFRLSSKALLKFNKANRGYGGNLQNIDKENLGEIYIPDEGKIFLKVDQAGAEALIVAYLCRNARYRSLFLNNIKPHTYMAMILFAPYWKKLLPDINIDYLLKESISTLASNLHWFTLAKAIKEDKEKYYVGKKTIHSASYGVKAPTLQMSILLDTNGTLSPTLKECRDWLGSFHDTFPEIQEWHSEVRDKLTKYHRLENLFGYPRMFRQPPGDDLWKSGYAFIPQSTVACITHKCITTLQDILERDLIPFLPFDILQNEHDGVLVQCDNNEHKINQIARICKEAMEQELTSPRGEKFRMKCEISIGKNLKDMEEYKL